MTVRYRNPQIIFSLIPAGVSIIFILIGRTFDALYYKIPFSERQSIKYEEPTNVIEINSNESVGISEDQLRKDDDCYVILFYFSFFKSKEIKAAPGHCSSGLFWRARFHSQWAWMHERGNWNYIFSNLILLMKYFIF
ncbi:hypothetical protein RhiirA5_507480 [Rhizophagus irregularis]|uniref:Uncharacterized protein n=1 Tax=Rhizophagus irregularis TaxID=588596 RepID=A0A2N0NJZ4_9GLOM|nr:hypothetical protein RhiirA5_507480 [Rhizophagus irregularis]